EELHALRLEVNALRFQHAAPGTSSTAHFPVRFPMQSIGDMQLLNMKLEETEIYTQLVTFLSGVGGTSMGECTRNVMRTLLTDEVEKTINWRGVNNRVSIASSPLAAAIVESIMKRAYPGVSHADVKGNIQRWIQKARLRATKEADMLAL
ncbi:hypothetical protein P879_10574, partial [Paragonimus westermani]